jgi:WD40 repeat protein
MRGSDCPTKQVLAAFNLGELPEPALEVISRHLEGCPACEAYLDSLDDRGDSALIALRRPGPARDRGRSRALAPSGAAAELPKVPGYEVLDLLGEGGMGVVYRARHPGLDRMVALKLLRGGSGTRLARFRAEALADARLQHPNIVQIFEIGEYQGLPYLALELLEGGSLEATIAGKPQAPRATAELVVVLARAIQYAHSRGIVHRDLKPGNLLLTAEGTPKIADFGLAKFLQADEGYTQEGDVLGTPRYMAPEQTAGDPEGVGPAADIYSLGVILYEMLTGRVPVQAPTPGETLWLVRTQKPVPPSRLQPRLPRDLEAICLKCLQKEPRRRYASAEELADDLERFLGGQPIRARPVGIPEKALLWVRRYPRVALLLALLAVAVCGGLAGMTWKWLEADEQRDRADASARQALDEKREALFQAYRARIAAAVAALSANDVADAARQLAAAPEELRDWEWRHLHSRLDDSSAVIRLRPGDGAPLLAGPEGPRVGIFTDTTVRFRDESGNESPERSFPGLSRASLSVVGSDHRWSLAAGGFSDLVLRDETEHAPRTIKPLDPIYNAIALSPDRSRLAAVLFPGRSVVGVYDTSSGRERARFTCEPGLITLAFAPDSRRLAAGGDGRVIHILDAETGKELVRCQGHTSKILSVAFREDGSRLLTTSHDGTVRQWDSQTGREVAPPYERHTAEVAAAVYSPDGRRVASAGADRTIRIWRAAGGHDQAVLRGHSGGISGLAFSRDGRHLASASVGMSDLSGDGTARFWETAPDATLPVLAGHTSYVYPVAYSPDGRWIASGGWDKNVRLWDAATGEACATLPHPYTVHMLAFTRDSSRLVSGSTDVSEGGYVWDLSTGQIRGRIAQGKGIMSLAVSPDGSQIAVGTTDGNGRYKISVLDTVTWKEVGLAEGLPRVFSPDGSLIAGIDLGRDVILRDAHTFRPVARGQGHTGAILSVAFDRDGRRLASAGTDRTVRLWDVATGRCERVLEGHTDDVFAVAFHPDGTRLATAGRDRAVWLWDLERGQEVARLPGHTSYIWSLAFSPDGSTLVSGSGDFTVRLWDTAPLKTRYQARRSAAALRPAAERLIERLWRQKSDPAAVVEALRADPALSEALRQAALRALLRRVRPPEAALARAPDPF